MNPSNSISREEFASPEAIERNYQRLARIGDRGRTGNLFAAPDAQAAASALGRIDADMQARADAAAAEPPPAPRQDVLSIFASGDDLPLFSS